MEPERTFMKKARIDMLQLNPNFAELSKQN